MPRKVKDGTAQPPLFEGTANAFEGFGPSLFRPNDEPVDGRKYRSKQPSRLRQSVREHAPRTPGVYGMVNEQGRLIYVGKAKNLRARLMSYFRPNSRHPKAAKIIRNTRVLVWERLGDEFAALLRELELIQTLRPKYNVQGVPGLKRHHYICIGKSPAPYVYVTNKPTGKELGVYGPLVIRSKSQEIARRLNDWFKLRDCPKVVPLTFTDQPTLFPEPVSAKCLRFELGTCHGPCVGACSKKDYGSDVRSVKAFLDGKNRSLLTFLQKLMVQAANDYEFEKATALRDRLHLFEWLDARLNLLRQARNKNSFVYPLQGHDGQARWYLIHRGLVQGVCRAPNTDDDRKSVTAFMTAAFNVPVASPILSAAAVDSVLLVVAWLRKQCGEKVNLLTASDAIKQCE